jgi:fumarate reductase iron-sulfur subunit
MKTLTLVRGEKQESFTHQSEGTILDALESIKQKVDPSVTFRSGCKSGICGCCAVVANGVEKLACTSKVEEDMVLSPLRNAPVIRDLVVNEEEMLSRHRGLKLDAKESYTLGGEAKERFSLQAECIECFSCASACPVMVTNKDFLGPFALTRFWRYVADERENNTQQKLEAIQNNGVWDCILCGDCAPVCPVGINPKNDISLLRTKSVAVGFMDPAMGSFSTSFGGDFGFGEVSFSQV